MNWSTRDLPELFRSHSNSGMYADGRAGEVDVSAIALLPARAGQAQHVSSSFTARMAELAKACARKCGRPHPYKPVVGNRPSIETCLSPIRYKPIRLSVSPAGNPSVETGRLALLLLKKANGHTFVTCWIFQ